MKKKITCLAALVAMGVSCGVYAADIDEQQLQEDETIYISGQVGIYNVVRSASDDGEGATAYTIEYRDQVKLPFRIRPVGSLMITSDDDWYLSVGVMRDVRVADPIILSGSFSAGLFHYGDKNVNLRNDLEFKSKIEAAYEFDNRMRLGVGFSHISNASLGTDNPGTEILSLNYTLPIN